MVMKSIYTRYTEAIVRGIEEALVMYPNASEAARELGIDVSGLIKHIKKYRALQETIARNKCGNKYKCDKHNEACDTCLFMEVYGRTKRCQNCKQNCNETCSEFTKIPNCERLKNGRIAVMGVQKKKNAIYVSFIIMPFLFGKY